MEQKEWNWEKFFAYIYEIDERYLAVFGGKWDKFEIFYRYDSWN